MSFRASGLDIPSPQKPTTEVTPRTLELRAKDQLLRLADAARWKPYKLDGSGCLVQWILVQPYNLTGFVVQGCFL